MTVTRRLAASNFQPARSERSLHLSDVRGELRLLPCIGRRNYGARFHSTARRAKCQFGVEWRKRQRAVPAARGIEGPRGPLGARSLFVLTNLCGVAGVPVAVLVLPHQHPGVGGGRARTGLRRAAGDALLRAPRGLVRVGAGLHRLALLPGAGLGGRAAHEELPGALRRAVVVTRSAWMRATTKAWRVSHTR